MRSSLHAGLALFSSACIQGLLSDLLSRQAQGCVCRTTPPPPESATTPAPSWNVGMQEGMHP